MRRLHEACRRLTTEVSQSRQQSFRPACPCPHRAVLTRSTSSKATLLYHDLFARAIASVTSWRASVLTFLCSNRALAGDLHLNCLRTSDAVSVHASLKRRHRSCHQAKSFRRIYRMRPCSISDRPGAVSSSRFRVHETAHSFSPSALSDGFDKSCPSPGDLLPEADVVRAQTQHSHLLRQTLPPFRSAPSQWSKWRVHWCRPSHAVFGTQPCT